MRGLAYLSCAIRLAGHPDWSEQYRRARLERLPEPVRRRYLELRRRREESDDADEAVAAEARRLAATTDFGTVEVARRMADRLEAELAAVNHEVNGALGDDAEQYFLAPDMRARLRALACPVLLVHGEADPRPIAAVEALVTELPRARLVRLPDVGHFLDWEAPDALRDLLRGFVTAVA